ncbi:MAG: peroxide stress protein YaaA [Lentisphaeraceae bacterium]|nr:peroxide stress protein YaaA [Lentisphaeraceae bacterium]
MILVISPAKTLDYESKLPVTKHTMPSFLDDSSTLIKELRKKSASDIKDLMKLSDKLAELNVDRYKKWSLPFDESNARQSMFAFKGDVYVGLDAYSLNKKDINFAQDHLRILSGLYGVLKPLDLMQPYRLEMGTRLQNKKGKNLYEFWGNKISEALNEEMNSMKSNVLVNLASNEYYSAVKEDSLKAEVITPQFLDFKNGKYKMISFFAKKARGMMCSWVIKNRIDTPEKLVSFDVAGYKFCKERSQERNPVFIREEQK